MVLHIWSTGTSGQLLWEGMEQCWGVQAGRAGKQQECFSDGPALPLLITPRSGKTKLPLGGKQGFQEKSVTLGWTFL